MRNRTFFVPAGVAVVAALFAINVSFSRDDGEDGAYAAADGLLTMVDAMDECDMNCYQGNCGQGSHKTESVGTGNDDGESHGSCWATGSCSAWHTCGVIAGESGGFALADLDELERLLPGLDVGDLRRLSSTHERFAVNWRRGAIQVFGCDDESVMLSVPLAPEQRAQLARLLN